MVKFYLDRKDFNEFDSDIFGLRIQELNDAFLLTMSESSDIDTLISYFNSEYKWDNMFEYEDVINRIDSNHILFILYYINEPIGYVFFEPKAKGEYYLYNLYVTKIIKRPENTPEWFVSKVISALPSDCKKITCYCEEWHKAAQNIFIKNNFNKI